MNRLTHGLLALALLAAASASGQSKCPYPLTTRATAGTPGVTQTPGSGTGGRITEAEYDQSWLSVDYICAGQIPAEGWGTALADGCVLEASSGALICGSGAGSHATSHQDGGADEVDPALLSSAACASGEYLAANGGGTWTCTALAADDDVPEAGDFGALALTGAVTSSGLATTLSADSVGLTHLAACTGPTKVVEYDAGGNPSCITTPAGEPTGTANTAAFFDSDGAGLVSVATILRSSDTLKIVSPSKIGFFASAGATLPIEIQPWGGVDGYAQFSRNGTVFARMNNSKLYSSAGTGAYLSFAASSATVPSVGPYDNESTTGFGRSAANEVSYISNSVQVGGHGRNGTTAVVFSLGVLRAGPLTTLPTCIAGLAGSMAYDDSGAFCGCGLTSGAGYAWFLILDTSGTGACS